MKAKQHFYALGQRAKSHGINRQRAVKHYHLEMAPPWAKHAFLAGWDAQCTEQVIEYKFEELDEKAQWHAKSTYFLPEHGWWEDVYEMFADGDALQRRFIDVDRWRAGGGRGIDIAFEMDAYDNVRDVTFDGDVNLRSLVEAQWAERAELPIVQALFDENVLPTTLRVGHHTGVRDIETQYDYDPMQHGVFAGVEPHHLIDGLGGDVFLDSLRALAETCVADFKHDLSKALEEEVEWLQSDEYVQEMCDANEYRFDEDGRML